MAKRTPDTKARILEAALTLFSARGYEPVTVAEIAEAVGIKAPSLYKHYGGKREIYNAILAELDSRYQAHMSLTNLDGREAEKDRAYYAGVDEDELVRFGLQLFRYYLHDEYASKFRKMLTLSQYTNGELADVFVRRFFTAPIFYQSQSFRLLAEAGRLAAEDPGVMALHYYAPMFLLLSMCDRQPGLEEEAIRLEEQHIRQFIRVYGK
jgi:AcrR family transcriptional regulator